MLIDFIKFDFIEVEIMVMFAGFHFELEVWYEPCVSLSCFQS